MLWVFFDFLIIQTIFLFSILLILILLMFWVLFAFVIINAILFFPLFSVATSCVQSVNFEAGGRCHGGVVESGATESERHWGCGACWVGGTCGCDSVTALGAGDSPHIHSTWAAYSYTAGNWYFWGEYDLDFTARGDGVDGSHCEGEDSCSAHHVWGGDHGGRGSVHDGWTELGGYGIGAFLSEVGWGRAIASLGTE